MASFNEIANCFVSGRLIVVAGQDVRPFLEYFNVLDTCFEDSNEFVEAIRVFSD